MINILYIVEEDCEITKSLNSLFAQNTSEFNVIFFINGLNNSLDYKSEDEINKKIKNHEFIFSNKPIMLPEIVPLALKKIKSNEFLYIANSDFIIKSNFAEEINECIENNPDVEIIQIALNGNVGKTSITKVNIAKNYFLLDSLFSNKVFKASILKNGVDFNVFFLFSILLNAKSVVLNNKLLVNFNENLFHTFLDSIHDDVFSLLNSPLEDSEFKKYYILDATFYNMLFSLLSSNYNSTVNFKYLYLIKQFIEKNQLLNKELKGIEKYDFIANFSYKKMPTLNSLLDLANGKK